VTINNVKQVIGDWNALDAKQKAGRMKQFMKVCLDLLYVGYVAPPLHLLR
jgi:hypothetical protein